MDHAGNPRSDRDEPVCCGAIRQHDAGRAHARVEIYEYISHADVGKDEQSPCDHATDKELNRMAPEAADRNEHEQNENGGEEQVPDERERLEPRHAIGCEQGKSQVHAQKNTSDYPGADDRPRQSARRWAVP